MVIILYLWYIQNAAPKLLLMAQPLKHPQSESDGWQKELLQDAKASNSFPQVVYKQKLSKVESIRNLLPKIIEVA